MTLTSNTPITQDNVALLKAGDWLRCDSIGCLAAFERVSFQAGHINLIGWPGYARATDFTYIGPDLGDGWIGWGGGPNPVPGMRVDVKLRHSREIDDTPSEDWVWQHDDYLLDDLDHIIAFRPALAKPAEGVPSRCEKCGHEHVVFWTDCPTPQSVDWSVVGPKLVEALEEISRNRATKLPGDEWAETYIGGHCAASEKYADIADAALAAARPQSNGD